MLNHIFIEVGIELGEIKVNHRQGKHNSLRPLQEAIIHTVGLSGMSMSNELT